MSVTGIPTKASLLTFMFKAPNPKPQIPSKIPSAKAQKKCAHDPPFFEIIDEKMSVSSRASEASASRSAPLFLVNPVSINRKNKRLSFASLRQIFTRIRKSFLLERFVGFNPIRRDRTGSANQLPNILSVADCSWQALHESANRFPEKECSILQVTRFSTIIHLGNWDLRFTWDLE